MSWKDFEEDSPELASLGFEKLNRKITYLAMSKKDGSPRLNPVTPFIENGMLFIFTEPSSPKIQDLRWDGRYAMHSAVSHLLNNRVPSFSKVLMLVMWFRLAILNAVGTQEVLYFA